MRSVTVSTVCFGLPDPGEDTSHITKSSNLRKARSFIDEAATRRSDLVVLPELFATKHTGARLQDMGEPIPEGEISQALAAAACEHGLYVAGCMVECLEGCLYNTVALFGRRGELAGKYRKVHLGPGEDEVCRCGRTYPVFKTDFGTIGAVVCYDLLFPEAVRCLALAGAEVILWPTMFSEPRAHFTGILMRARAIENQVWLVSSSYSQPALGSPSCHIGRSAIVDWDGMVLADTGRREAISTASVDLDERAGRGIAGFAYRLLEDRGPSTYQALAEGSDALRYRGQIRVQSALQSPESSAPRHQGVGLGTIAEPARSSSLPAARALGMARKRRVEMECPRHGESASQSKAGTALRRRNGSRWYP